METFDNFLPLKPITFFNLSFDCPYFPYNDSHLLLSNPLNLIPNTSALCQENSFGSLYMGWNAKGLAFAAKVDLPVSEVFYPEIRKGDSLELFIDTRNIKTTSFNTKFCHHFFFLPKEIEGVQAGEITRFRTDDSHELCNSFDINLKAEIYKKYYILNLFIPSHCLHGYDPEQCDHLGFTYRLNRYNGPSQHFSVVSDEFNLEQHPSTWSSVHLTPNCPKT